jgi:hypothetical protein
MAFLRKHRSETLILRARRAGDAGAQTVAGLAGIMSVLALVQHVVL